MKHFHKYSSEYAFHLYTLINIKKANVIKTNPYCISFIDQLINLIVPKIQMSDIVNQAYQFIEKNPLLLKYEDMTYINIKRTSTVYFITLHQMRILWTL